MIVLHDGPVDVHYGFLSLAPDGVSPDFALARKGQRNGLCSAGVPGMLSMVTGLHTGAVPFRIELHQRAPRLPPAGRRSSRRRSMFPSST
jgi:gamma-glutamyltranspeptidase